MGEGGAITTNNPTYAETMRRLRSHGMASTPDVGPWAYEMPDLGYNFRVTDVQCALGLSQLKKLERFVGKRRALAEMYNERLRGMNALVQVPKATKDSESGWHLYSVRIDYEGAGKTRTEVMEELKDKGIGTQVHYIPIHTQPYYVELYGEINLPGAQSYYARTLSLPLFPAMEEQDVERVCAALRAVLS